VLGVPIDGKGALSAAEQRRVEVKAHIRYFIFRHLDILIFEEGENRKLLQIN
jgi:hypothetical protein